MKKLITIITVGLAFLSAQAADNSWTTYSSTRNIHALTATGNYLWAATDGGLMQINLSSKSLVRTYTNVHGLPNIIIYDVKLAGDNALWTGGFAGGLSRYQPQTNTWNNYQLDDKNITISSIAIWSPTTVYLGTNKGVILFIDGEMKETYSDFVNENEVPINDIMIASDSILWLATDRGVYRSNKKPNLANLGNPNLKDPTSWTVYKAPAVVDNKVKCLVVHAGAVWIGTAQGVSKYSQGTWTAQNNGWNAPQVNQLFSNGNMLWAATSDSIYKYDGNQWQTIPTNGLYGLSANTITIDGSGLIWIGTPWSGVAYFDPGRNYWWYVPLNTQQPLGNFISSLTLEGDTSVWFGGFSWNGIFNYSYNQNTWSYLAADVKERVCNITIDVKGNKWFASYGAGLYRLTPQGTLLKYDQTNSPIYTMKDYDVVSDVGVDENGKIWVCNMYNKVLVFDSVMNQERIFYSADSISSQSYYCMDIDLLQRIWIGTGYQVAAGGAFFIGDHCEGVFDNITALPSNYINKIKHDTRNRVWIATESGLSMYDDNVWVFNKDNALLKGISVYDFDFDTLGNVWAATKDYGVFHMTGEGDTIFHYTNTNSKLVNNTVYAIAVNRKSGDVWIGTFHGISRYASPFGAPPADNTQVKVYPNPWVFSKGNADYLTFNEIIPGSSISIFTFSGELIYKITGNNNNGNRVTWSGTNQDRKKVATGLYYFVVYSAATGFSSIGKFAIIR